MDLQVPTIFSLLDCQVDQEFARQPRCPKVENYGGSPTGYVLREQVNLHFWYTFWWSSL